MHHFLNNKKLLKLSFNPKKMVKLNKTNPNSPIGVTFSTLNSQDPPTNYLVK